MLGNSLLFYTVVKVQLQQREQTGARLSSTLCRVIHWVFNTSQISSSTFFSCLEVRKDSQIVVKLSWTQTGLPGEKLSEIIPKFSTYALSGFSHPAMWRDMLIRMQHIYTAWHFRLESESRLFWLTSTLGHLNMLTNEPCRKLTSVVQLRWIWHGVRTLMNCLIDP